MKNFRLARFTALAMRLLEHMEIICFSYPKYMYSALRKEYNDEKYSARHETVETNGNKMFLYPKYMYHALRKEYNNEKFPARALQRSPY